MSDAGPNGSIQALAIGASALLVTTIAFLWWWTFGLDAEWTPDSMQVLVVGGLGVAALAAVPVLATSPSATSLRRARLAYTLGAFLAIASIAMGMAQAFELSKPESAIPDNADAACPSCEPMPPARGVPMT